MVVKVPNHTHTEIRVWIGFAVALLIAFLVTILAPSRMTGEQIETVWIVAISAVFINHGIWDRRERFMILWGSLSIAAVLVSLALVPTLYPIGWVILGCGIAFSGFYPTFKMHGFVGIYLTLGGIVRLLLVYLPTTAQSMELLWMVLVGLILITLSMESKNPVLHYWGASWIVVSLLGYIFWPEGMFLPVAIVFFLGVTANLIYLYRVLERRPKIEDILSFVTGALFLRGLKKPIDQYRVIAFCIEGDIGAERVISDLTSRLEPRCMPLILLGPTAPTQISIPKDAKVGWVAPVSGTPELNYSVISPEDPTTINIFLSKVLETLPEDRRPVILGDFLDNMIPNMSEELFYKYYSDLASRVKISNHTALFIVNADIHREVDISVVKRFADVVIENREREERGKLIREIRVSNRVDNIYTNWEKY